MSDSEQKINDASAIIFREISECFSNANNLQELVGASQADHLIQYSEVHTEQLKDGAYRQTLRGENAATAARFIHALLRNSGAKEVSRIPLGAPGTDDAVNRAVSYSISRNEEQEVVRKYQAAAQWLATRKNMLTKIFSVSVLADRDRQQGMGTKITPNILPDGTNNSLVLKIQTNEPSLITALEQGGFQGEQQDTFKRTNAEAVKNSKVYNIHSNDIDNALDIVHSCFSTVRRIAGSMDQGKLNGSQR